MGSVVGMEDVERARRWGLAVSRGGHLEGGLAAQELVHARPRAPPRWRLKVMAWGSMPKSHSLIDSSTYQICWALHIWDEQWVSIFHSKNLPSGGRDGYKHI
jgi:hypothetical protein